MVCVGIGCHTGAILVTSCRTFYGDGECWAVYRTYNMGGAAAVRTYVPSIVQEPLMATSETILLSATTETLEVITFERSRDN
jgi:hypothetical protein